tara:strand:+ start:875 stop:1072 length:198 start_codon:yes stop_codon:yes gene_type:complete
MAINLPPPGEEPEYVSISEFGQIFGKSRYWVKLVIKEKNLKVKRIGLGAGTMYLPYSEVERLLAD